MRLLAPTFVVLTLAHWWRIAAVRLTDPYTILEAVAFTIVSGLLVWRLVRQLQAKPTH
jgi:hypothetical protein